MRPTFFRKLINQRLFSTAIAKVPEQITKKFNDSHDPSKGLISKLPSSQSIEKFSDELLTNLYQLVKTGDQDANKLLYTLDGFKSGEFPAICLKDGPTKGKSLFYLSDIITHICGYTPFSNREHVLHSNDHPKYVPPHTDGGYSPNGPNIDVATLYATNAPFGNYRTGTIKIEDVLLKLSEKDIKILKQNFFRHFCDEFGKNNIHAAPILFMDAQQNLRVSYGGIDTYDLSYHLGANREDARKALINLDTAIKEVVRMEDKVFSAQLKSGDILIYDNGRVLHFKDQQGVAEEYKNKDREVRGRDYEKNDASTNESITQIAKRLFEESKENSPRSPSATQLDETRNNSNQI